MNDSAYPLRYILLIIAQILIWNYCNFSQYAMLTFLPIMIMYTPVNQGYVKTLLIAFITGFAVDFFSDGMLGLTSAALLPVAFFKRGFITMIFGSEVFAREETITVQRQGAAKVSLSIILSTALFLALYIWIDGAGTRPFWFNLTKFGISLGISSIVSFLSIQILESDNR